jgi:cytosine/adenosine deaminase-related metal-dependent hydrolase/ubiquinone/menaquinone biosynthesis C-methylase UbiE
MSASPNMSVVSAPEQAGSAFALWAEVYDHQPNPFLSLEERCVEPLLPEVQGHDVLDAGCGTGRWLKLLASHSPRRLIGVDSSREMLDRAQAKLGDAAEIRLGDCGALPISASSVDIVIASFVLSYLESLEDFAAELRRVTRPGGRVFVTDLHPETAASCGWKRSFQSMSGSIELHTHYRTLQEIVDRFWDAGLRAKCILEPSFGIPEEAVLRKAGKLQAYELASGLPAIYILQLELPDSDAQSTRIAGHDLPLSVTNASVAVGPRTTAKAKVSMRGGQIDFVGSRPIVSIGHPSAETQLDLTGYLLLPGLINSHDHLEFGLFPQLGHGRYQNSQAWAADIQNADAETIAKLRGIPKDVRLWWGAIRNLLCGVTTVCHHNPLTPELLEEDFPVRVLPAFGWAHSLSLEPDIAVKFQATSAQEPFILHAAEGTDSASASEVFELDRLQLLGDRTVLVHGLALNEEGAALINRRRTALVWCPISNEFLFGRTHTREFLNSVDNVVLGSDSLLTCRGDLLDDVRFAYSQVGIDADELYRMLLSRPAKVFRMHGGQGTLRPGACADLIAVRDTGADPATTVCEMSAGDIGLVIVRGRVQLASDSLIRRLPTACITGLRPLEVDGSVVWIRAPLGWLFEKTAEVLGSDITLGSKRVRHVCTAWL